jgi:hypothetical protein
MLPLNPVLAASAIRAAIPFVLDACLTWDDNWCARPRPQFPARSGLLKGSRPVSQTNRHFSGGVMRSVCFVCLFVIFSSMVFGGIGPLTHYDAAQVSGHAQASNESRSLSKPKPETQGRILQTYGNLPLSFERNQGQTDPQVRFLSRGRGYALFLTADEAVFSLHGEPDNKRRATTVQGRSVAPELPRRALRGSLTALRMKLVNANPTAEIVGADELPGKSNYFLGNDPEKWRTDVPTYAKIRYRNVYSGIDLVYYGNQGQLEYDFVVAPGADLHRIQLDIHGAKNVRREAQGDLLLQVAGTEIRWRKPVVYQEKDGKRKGIAGRYLIRRGNRIGFKVATYDQSRPLVIDPGLVYSTYLGGSGDDGAVGVAIDGSGNAYVTGYTSSADFPTKDAFQKNYGGGQDDAFVTKIDNAGTSIVYSTFLGGSDIDGGSGIAVDSSGAAYVTGETSSTDFPVMHPIQKYGGNTDAFVTKLDATGSALVYSTYLGGSQYDDGVSITTDGNGNGYVTGETNSTDFPITRHAFQMTLGGQYDAFAVKLNAKGTALSYSTYLGGSNDDVPRSIVTDIAGHAYVTGYTYSTDFPTTSGAFQTQHASDGGEADAFVTEFNTAGSALVYSTYLGGNNRDDASGIAVDSSGKAYVAGDTESTDFPIKNAYQGKFGGQADAFVTVFNSKGSALVYSTYLGGSAVDYATGVGLDSSGNAYIVGVTEGSDFPVTKDAFQSSFGGYSDAFFAEFSAAGSLSYSTYFGGSDFDDGYAIAVGKSTTATAGGILLAGDTRSTNFPTRHPLLGYRGGYDGFVAKFARVPVVTFVPPRLHFAKQKLHTTSKPEATTLTNTGEADLHITNITVDGDFAQTNNCPINGSLAPGKKCEIDVTFTPTQEGTRNGHVTITDDALNSPQKLPLTGIGGAPLVSLFPPNLDFGNQTVNVTSSPKTTTLIDTGNLDLHITSIAVTGTDSGDFAESNNCGKSIPPNARCDIKVTFTPSTTGKRTADVTVTDDAPDSPQNVLLSGVGVLPAVRFNPTKLKFSTQLVYTTSPAQKVTLTNTGKGILLISNIAVKRPFFQTNDCGQQVDPGAHCTIIVKFRPTTKGDEQGAITVTDNAPGSPQQVPLSGIGTYIQLVPRKVNFGSQPVGTRSRPRTIWLTNKGDSAVNIQSIAITGADSGDFAQTNNCGNQVASGASCHIKVTFEPLKKGERNADVSITDDGGGSPQEVKLKGLGT